jgi:outer membrane immunogenic protein
MFKRLVFLPVIVGLTGYAHAADLPNRAPPPFAPPPVFTWTGVYIGGNVGYAWGSSTNLVPVPGIPTYSDPSSPIGGGQFGYNFQIQQFVLGFEADLDGTGYKKSGVTSTGVQYVGINMPVEGSARGRIGFAWDRLLVYGTGGAAFGDSKTSFLPPNGIGSYSNTVFGWTAGGGIEYGIDRNWSVRAEYRYTYFSGYTVPSNLAATGIRHQDSENLATVGFNYRFDFGAPPVPVVAKY